MDNSGIDHGFLAIMRKKIIIGQEKGDEGSK
jgi:hypothetical protein